MPTFNIRKQSNCRIFPAVLGIILIAFFFPSCNGDAEKVRPGKSTSSKKPVPVTVYPAEEKTLPIEIESTGHVEAGLTVNVRSRVSGQLESVHFTEGDEVAVGDPLFTIDPAPFQAKVSQARAELARDMAKRDLAARQVARNTPLMDQGFISQQEYDQLTSDVSVLDASILADRAALTSATLELSYCSITAVADGIAGAVTVDQGNLVGPGDSSPLVTINRISPLHVSFAVPEQVLPGIRSGMAKGTLPVRAAVQGQTGQHVQGHLFFIDNAIDPATGTVLLKARFPNEDKALWPGQFVRVNLGLSEESRGIAIPSQAVQTGQNGTYVYVLKPDQTVEYRDVSVARSFNGDALIARGLSAGDKVVVDGQLKLSDGAPVTVLGPGRLDNEKAATP